MLDSVEFARGSPNSTWGSVRANLGHPTPFKLNYISFGNEGCFFKSYIGNYVKFYKALKKIYPDIKVITNCDATEKSLDHPADIYDFHKYTNISEMLELTQLFGKMKRDPLAPKAFVSEYAVRTPQDQMKNGTFGGALAEAAFLLSLEQNCDIVEMVSYAPLFVNQNNRNWNPDAISFNSYQVFGKASFWVQTFFRKSSGATLLSVDFPYQPKNTFVTAISWTTKKNKSHLMIKVVNYNDVPVNMNISIDGVHSNSIIVWRKIVLASDGLLADNTFENPSKVVPILSTLNKKVEKDIVLKVQPYSLTAFDLVRKK